MGTPLFFPRNKVAGFPKYSTQECRTFVILKVAPYESYGDCQQQRQQCEEKANKVFKKSQVLESRVPYKITTLKFNGCLRTTVFYGQESPLGKARLQSLHVGFRPAMAISFGSLG